MSETTVAYIALGSNLGDREGYIAQALQKIDATEGLRVTDKSDLVETRPLGTKDQPEYINAVARTQTNLNVVDLFSTLQIIENELGRKRKNKWSARTIDLDLLLFGSEIIEKPGLKVPHPQMHLRSFVLNGLCQLNRRLVHPILGVTVGELASRLNGMDFLINADIPQLVCIAGNIGVGKTTLSKKLSEEFKCRLILEAYDKNPFLAKVYAGQKELALDSQLFFLTSRINQLNTNSLMKGELVFSDYVFDKEIIYAKELLDETQFGTYEEAYRSSSSQISSPVLVIYMSGSPKECIERIYERNRPYEQAIEQEFLEKLDADYEELFKEWKKCPVINLLNSKFDCMRDSDIKYLINQIKFYISLQS
ncbi:MAG: 2-amino-4-hydroxy-6-hydroxymethyldihydropteridine diphosphokinase [Planctomycetota bacterium]|jgi:2-amino-4-hydroxy-6-hydroxymethyldihydropteridine diphosphokinase